MHRPHCTVALALLSAISVLAVCGSPAATARAAQDQDLEDSNAQIMTAEIALRRDDCGRAAADYTAAAQRLTDGRLARRAAEVALDCGQYQLAEHAAARWRQLMPADPAPLRATMRAALGLYNISAARTAFESWLQSTQTQVRQETVRNSHSGAAAGAAGGTVVATTAGADIAKQVQLVAEESGVPATLAMLQGVEVQPLQTPLGQLALADLAFDGWNYRQALQYAQHALSVGAERASAEALLARAHAGLGEVEQAEAAASAARAAAPKEQSFAGVDVLMALGREREARQALEALDQDPVFKSQAQRRLGLLAFDRGDYDEAQRDFSELLSDHDSAAIAVYYLAVIAERRDDTETALHGYQLLSGTALESAARMRAATVLYKQGQRTGALRLLAAADDASPPAWLDAEIAQVQLLSNGGEADQALARLNDALARFPEHPDLLYQKAIVLEKGGQTSAAVVQLESLYRERPQDSAIANALGFILADHSRELERAERLISAALKAEPDNPAILDSLGWLDYHRGQPQAALPLLERAFRLDQDGDIGAHWGEVLWAVGDKSKARDAWDRALIADPDNALVKAAQQRVGAPALLTPGTGTSI